MRIVIAPDKFKGCLRASEVAQAMERGARRAGISEIDCCPMADGGEGTIEALAGASGGTYYTRHVTGPLPEMKLEAKFAILGDGTAVVETAAASGLALLKESDRNPLRTTTFGTGQLLLAASEMGVSQIILGLGGSATVDGGVGCAQACGLPVILEGGESVSPGEPLTGADVGRVVLIKHGRGSPIEKVRIVAACDVTNPLLGPNGAAAVYGPQKGAGPAEVRQLDAALEQLVRRTGTQGFANLAGAGAAGGLGFGVAAFLGAELKPGIEIVMEAVGLRRRLAEADLCLTGEGRLDRSSLSGKTVSGVARICREMQVPCVAIGGSVEAGVDFPFDAIRIGEEGMSLEQSIQNAPELIAKAVEKVVRRFLPTLQDFA